MNFRICDLHNDLPSIIIKNDNYDINNYNEGSHTDVPRLKKGKVAVQFFAVCPCTDSQLSSPYSFSMKIIEKFKHSINSTSEIVMCCNGSAAEKIIEQKQIAAVLALEGGHAIENSLENLEHFFASGVRYLTVTWNNSNNWAVSALDERSATTGLSTFGRDVIRKMNDLNMIIDVSHTGKKTVKDILEISSQPVIASHTGAYALNNHPRNLTDDQIKNISESGGVIGVVFYPPFLNPTGIADLEAVINHIDYIASLTGTDSVAIGSDFDGIGTNTVKELNDVSKFPLLIKSMENRGFSSEEIEKIIFSNSFNTFKNICG